MRKAGYSDILEVINPGNIQPLELLTDGFASSDSQDRANRVILDNLRNFDHKVTAASPYGDAISQ